MQNWLQFNFIWLEFYAYINGDADAILTFLPYSKSANQSSVLKDRAATIGSAHLIVRPCDGTFAD
jgi:hypothetical protein